MKLSKTTIALAMAGFCFQAYALDTTFVNKEPQLVDIKNWTCKQCSEKTMSGNMQVGVAHTDSDNKRTLNSLGTTAGLDALVDANVKMRTGSQQLHAKAYMTDPNIAYGQVSIGEYGLYRASVFGSTKFQQDANNAYSAQYIDQNGLITNKAYRDDLYKQRDEFGFKVDLEFNLFDLNVFNGITYKYDNAYGNKALGLLQRQAPLKQKVQNIIKPYDTETNTLDAFVGLSGEQWQLKLDYSGSLFSNSIDAITDFNGNQLYADAPDNESHQLAVSGFMQLDNTLFAMNVARGVQQQDDDLLYHSDSDYLAWNGKVELSNNHLSIDHRFNTQWKVKGAFESSSREHSGARYQLGDYGQVTRLLDKEINKYNLSTQYQFNRELKSEVGFELKNTVRQDQEREEVDENQFWVKADYQFNPNLKLNAKLSYLQRDGSAYEANQLTSESSNAIIRKYYLADMEGGAFNFGANYTYQFLDLGVKTQYKYNDYIHTRLGLTESTSIGVDVYSNVTVNNQLRIYANAGVEQIDNNQSSGFESDLNWLADTQDSFVYVGAGAIYQELFDLPLSINMDYRYSESDSQSRIQPRASADYFNFTHQFDISLNYELSKSDSLSLSYRYERYFDTDAANVDIDAILGLTTLGLMDNNFNAHQVSFLYKKSF